MSLRPPSSDITVPGGGGQRQFPNEVTASYPPGGVPRTPLELRVGPHPKKVTSPALQRSPAHG